MSMGRVAAPAETRHMDGSHPRRREFDEEILMNRHTSTERCYDPMILLTRCHLEILDREPARNSHMPLVHARRRSHMATAFRRPAHAGWRNMFENHPSVIGNVRPDGNHGAVPVGLGASRHGDGAPSSGTSSGDYS
jgi:hypothetical protein